MMRSSLLSVRTNLDAVTLAWPSVVEIEVSVRCNRSCIYCPNSKVGSTSPFSFMDIELFRRIIAQLSQISFSGRLSFHFYNEPLMRKDLEKLVAIARAPLP